jgi:hypothetical protein
MLLTDFNLFKAPGKHTKILQLLYDALQTVKPTPSKSEHVFSIAENFTMRIQCHLIKDSLNALVFPNITFCSKQLNILTSDILFVFYIE